jgi:phage tail protein X
MVGTVPVALILRASDGDKYDSICYNLTVDGHSLESLV